MSRAEAVVTRILLAQENDEWRSVDDIIRELSDKPLDSAEVAVLLRILDDNALHHEIHFSVMQYIEVAPPVVSDHRKVTLAIIEN